MKFTLVLSIVLTLVSCGTTRNGQLRLVKVNNREIAVIEKNIPLSQPIGQETELSTAKIETETIQNHDIDVTSEKPSEWNQPNQTKQIALDVPLTKKLEPEPTDSLSAKEIENQALEAERLSKIALGFSIGGITIPLLFFLGIASFIVGSIYYGKANKMKYITPEGERNLKISKVFIIIEGVLLGLAVIAILIILVLFLLALSWGW